MKTWFRELNSTDVWTFHLRSQVPDLNFLRLRSPGVWVPVVVQILFPLLKVPSLEFQSCLGTTVSVPVLKTLRTGPGSGRSVRTNEHDTTTNNDK